MCQEKPLSGPRFGSEWRQPGYPVLIGSGTMDVGELLSYQVGAVGRAEGLLILARVAGTESHHLASSRSLALTSRVTPACILVIALHSPSPRGPFDPFLLQA